MIHNMTTIMSLRRCIAVVWGLQEDTGPGTSLHANPDAVGKLLVQLVKGEQPYAQDARRTPLPAILREQQP